MALPNGCRKVCRPNRSIPRKFSVSDIRRISCLLREQGVPSEEIIAAVQECAPAGECDCERIAVAVAIAVALLALVVAVRTKNKIAMQAARDAIARAQRTSSAQVGRIELEKAQAELVGAEAAGLSIEEQGG